MDDLSELAEVSLTTVGKIERGIQSPSVETLVRIATALEVEAGALIRGVVAEDYGERAHHYTARDFIRDRQAQAQVQAQAQAHAQAQAQAQAQGKAPTQPDAQPLRAQPGSGTQQSPGTAPRRVEQPGHGVEPGTASFSEARPAAS